jgi:catechol 2,3-dioxygenase-like lactoylglutathione lyase family enzyme
MNPYLYQVAGALEDAEDTAHFYGKVLGCPILGRFDPPGLLFVGLGASRLMLQSGASPATVYVWPAAFDSVLADLERAGVALEQSSQPVFEDAAGQFGPPGETEWMAFCRDPSGNLVGLVTRRPSEMA